MNDIQPTQEISLPAALEWEWPKTRFGTVNWEVVFENPNFGLVPLARDTTTPADLKETTLQIIAHLFPRDADDKEIARFGAELDRLIPDGTAADALPALHDAITLILREIRDFRMERARAYELAQMAEAELELAESQTEVQSEPQARGKGGDDRRRGGDRRTVVSPKIMSVEGLMARKKPISITGGLLAAGLALFLVLGTDPVATVNSVVNAPSLEEFLAEMEQASNDKTTKTHVFGGILHVSEASGRMTVTASAVPRSICMSATRALLRGGTILINGRYSQKLEMEQLNEMCSSAGATAQLTWRPRPPDPA